MESLPVKPNLGMQAAKASWVAPIICVFLNMTANGAYVAVQAKIIIGFASFALYIMGLGLGIFALTKVRQYGSKGIAAPAITGIVINAILVLIFSLALFVAVASRR